MWVMSNLYFPWSNLPKVKSPLLLLLEKLTNDESAAFMMVMVASATGCRIVVSNRDPLIVPFSCASMEKEKRSKESNEYKYFILAVNGRSIISSILAMPFIAEQPYENILM